LNEIDVRHLRGKSRRKVAIDFDREEPFHPRGQGHGKCATARPDLEERVVWPRVECVYELGDPGGLQKVLPKSFTRRRLP
jgi:hypothetical protein